MEFTLIKNGNIATVTTAGGELISFVHNGREYLWNGSGRVTHLCSSPSSVPLTTAPLALKESLAPLTISTASAENSITFARASVRMKCASF